MIRLDDLPAVLSGAQATAQFQALYGADPDRLASQRQRWLQLADSFRREFPEHARVSFFSSPGRIEIGGNHTDHQCGRVLCAAVDLDIIAIAAPSREKLVRLTSAEFDRMDQIDLHSLLPRPDERGHSSALIRGIAAACSSRGLPVGGFDACTASRVPKGSGLSSSAAFEILVVSLFEHFSRGNRVSPVEKALIAQYAENEYFGKPCGLMDQCACALGGFLMLDFQRPDQPLVLPLQYDFPRAGCDLVITNTGGSHADLADEYSSIRGDMRRIASLLGCEVLRQADPADFWRRLPELRAAADDRQLLRAMHFFADDARVVEQAAALQEGRTDDFLDLVRASGISSWTCLQNVHAACNPHEQPLSLGLAASGKILAGRGACRVHGGGFAGTIQAFVPLDLTDDYMTAMRALFGKNAPEKVLIRPAGAMELELT